MRGFMGNSVSPFRPLFSLLAALCVSAPKKVRYLAKPPTVGNIYNEVCLPLLPFEAGE